MKLKLYELAALDRIRQIVNTTRLSFATGYKFVKLFDSLETNFRFYQDSMQKIVNEYAYRDENGDVEIIDKRTNTMRIADNKLIECKKKLEELDEVEIDVADVKFTFDELSALKVNGDEIRVLEKFIDQTE